ncbi:hypothetical protein GCM10023091_13200 [Ravibacter arvi]|uniref:Lipoprotein n=1 Tax=Ravibacter arvi TaxID=2051041 RepID=A0ABP8LST1_9BACT
MNFRNLLLLCWLFSLAACTDNNYQPSAHLSASEQNEFKASIIRYIAPLPKKGNHSTKFEPVFDQHYQKQTGLFRLDKYYPSADGYIYFEVSRMAPSFQVKRVATAGRLKRDKNGKIHAYEEVYRTWKMDEETLARRTKKLFDSFLNHEDLSPYETANSEEEFIEFPDGQIKYDKNRRMWAGNFLEDSLSALR